MANNYQTSVDSVATKNSKSLRSAMFMGLVVWAAILYISMTKSEATVFALGIVSLPLVLLLYHCLRFFSKPDALPQEETVTPLNEEQEWEEERPNERSARHSLPGYEEVAQNPFSDRYPLVEISVLSTSDLPTYEELMERTHDEVESSSMPVYISTIEALTTPPLYEDQTPEFPQLAG